MNRPMVLLILLAATACSFESTLPPTAPSTDPFMSASVPVRNVAVGELVEAVFGNGDAVHPEDHRFLVTVPTSGTLVVSLGWDPAPLGTLLMLRLEDHEFAPSPPEWSPVVGRLTVEAGKQYTITVALRGADWTPQDPYVLTTRLER